MLDVIRDTNENLPVAVGGHTVMDSIESLRHLEKEAKFHPYTIKKERIELKCS